MLHNSKRFTTINLAPTILPIMILVTGALGFVGQQLVARLLAENHAVRVLIPERGQRRLPWGDVEVFSGSIFDAPALYRAMSGVHTVFHLASAQWWGRYNDLEHVDLNGTRAVAEAGRSARVGRIIYLSHLGAEPAAGFDLLRMKGQAESVIRHSGIPYTIFRCGVLFGEKDQFVNHIAMTLRSNPFVILQPGHGDILLNPLHIDDLVQALVNGLESIDLIDQVIEIGGAEYISFNEMLRTVMRVSGAQRRVMALPPYLLRGFATLWRLLPLRFPITPQWFDVLASNRTAPLGNLYSYTGVRPRRFEDTLLTYMPKRRYWWEYLRYLVTRRRRSAY